MEDTQDTVVFLTSRNRQAAVEVLEFLEQLSPQEQNEFMNFIHGAKFMMILNRQQQEEEA